MRAEERIHLGEQQLHVTVDGDLPGGVCDGTQRMAPAVIDRLRAPVFPSVLWFRRFGKSATKPRPSQLVWPERCPGGSCSHAPHSPERRQAEDNRVS